MHTIDAIRGRRSIRKFQAKPIPREIIEEILDLSIQAPSAKNAQPWRFVVLQGERNLKLVRIMRDRAAELEAHGVDIGSLAWTAKAMEPAPVTIMVFNAPPDGSVPIEARSDYEHVMVQSTGGAIQTMLLAAQALGIGSLWICDVLYACDEIRQWLGYPDHTLVAAVTLGYADETPGARPRKPWREVTEWMDAQ